MRRASAYLLFVVVVAFAMPNLSLAAGPGLANPGFDVENASGGDVAVSAGWLGFNNAFVTQSVPAHSAPNTLKAFGPGYVPGASGAFQGDFPANPGQVWRASAWARIDSSDPMNPANLGQVVLRFLPSDNFGLDIVSQPITTSTLPMNTWQEFSAIGVAPAGTTQVRIELHQVQLSSSASNGSLFFDDASLTNVPEPAAIVLGTVALFSWLASARRRSN